MQRGKSRAKTLRSLGVVGLLVGVLTGCIRPDLAPTATPSGQPLNVSSNNTPINPQPTPAGQMPAFDLQTIELKLREYGAQPVPGTLILGSFLPQGLDTVLSFYFKNPSGLDCVGAGAFNPDLLVGSNCATEPGTPAVTGQWLFLSNAGGPIVVVVARILITDRPILTATVTFEDGFTQTVNIVNNNLLFIRPGISFANSLQLLDAANAPASPAQVVPRS